MTGVFTKMLLRRIYVQELELLTAYAGKRSSAVGASMGKAIA